jgi:hypothetical protein
LSIFSEEYLAKERRALGDNLFNREFLGIPGGAHTSLFSWEMYDRATRVQHL